MHYPSRRRDSASSFPDHIWSTTTWVLAAAVLLAAGPSWARTTWHVNLRRTWPQANTTLSAKAAADLFVQHHAAALGLKQTALRPMSVLQWRDRSVVRMLSYCKGLRVFGAEARALVGSDGVVEALVTDMPGVCHPTATKAAITPDAALDAVQAYWDVRGTFCDTANSVAELGLIQVAGRQIPVYRVLAPVGIIGHMHYVDAATGTVLWQSRILFDAMGRIYPENPMITPSTQDATLLHLDDENGPGNVLEGYDGAVKVYTQTGKTIQDWPNMEYEHLALGDNNGDFLQYDATSIQPVYDEPFTEVNLYHQITRIRDYFTTVHGVSFQQDLLGFANYHENGQPFDNAFFSPINMSQSVLVLGQGTSADFGYDADVIFHEFTHYVIDTVAHLSGQYFDEWGRLALTGAINEGLADYFSCSNFDDPTVGEYALGTYARDLSQQNGVCPDDIYGEPHMDGEIIGGVTWQIHEAIGAVEADDAIFGAITMLTPTASYKDFAEAVHTTVASMVSDGDLTTQDASDVDDLMKARNLFDCDRAMPLDNEGTTLPAYQVGLDTMGNQLGANCQTMRQYFPYWIPGNFQYKVTAPDDVSGIALHFHIQQTPANDLLYKVFIRKGQLVHYQMQTVQGGFQISVAQDYDAESPDITAATSDFTIDANSTPALEPGAEYYFAVGYRNCPDVQLQFSATTEPVTVQTDGGVDDGQVANDGGPTDSGLNQDGAPSADAATPEGPGPGRGCGCRASGSDAASWLPIVLLLGLAFIRRRRKLIERR